MTPVRLAVEAAGGYPGVPVCRVAAADLEDVADVQPQQELHPVVAGHADVASLPQLIPGRGVALERLAQAGRAQRRLSPLDQGVADRAVTRRGERHHPLD